MLSLDVVETFNHVSHIRLLHTLRMRRTLNYIIKWTCSFLKDKESSLTFNEQISAMRRVNADISQEFFISSILFLFFNASLIEKCEALEIKIKVLNFVNDINILIYDKITESICKTLSQAHDVCAKWARTHDATFASEKYELTHFIRKSKRFDMTVSLCIENSIIKSKSNVWILEVQLNTKLQWDSHLRQIEADHVIKMLMLSWLEIFIWETTFAKARQIYSAMIRSEMTFEASIWHQRNKEEELSSTKQRLETLQNQALCHVIDVFKKVNIETLKVETYTSSLHVHLNKLQNQVTLRSWVNDRTQKTRWACEIIHARLIETNRLISRFSISKKMTFLNVSIRERAKIQSRRRQLDFLTSTQTSERAIAQFHKSQWDLRWENYKKCIADINTSFAQRSHLFKKSVRMHDDFQKIKSILATHIRIERIELNVYLHSRNVSSANSSRCDCEWSHQTVKHILMNCSNWTHLRLNMLRDIDFTNYRIIVSITKNLKTTARMMMKTKLLKQFKVARTLIL